MITWHDMNDDTRIPMDKDLLVAVEDKKTHETKIIISRRFLHKMTPSSKGIAQWTVRQYFFEDYNMLAWSENMPEFGYWNEVDDCDYVCSDCGIHWTTSDIKNMHFCPSCGKPKFIVKNI